MKKLQPDVWKLLRRNLSHGQLIGFTVANVVGLTVILVGLLFYFDSRHSTASDDGYFGADYVVISKHVDGIGFTPVGFDSAEIQDIARQPWVNKLGRFTASRFAVSGTVGVGGRGFSSYMFLESVPDEFFDVKPRDWSFRPGQHFVPIVISKDYLTLYNFGFALPQGLPQVSEEVVGAVPIQLRIMGQNFQSQDFEAAIVGFSSRLNTIAVPQSFMDWANARFAPDSAKVPPPSRLILNVDPLASRPMRQYFDQHGIEVGGSKDDNSQISEFLGLMSAVITGNGVLISTLAFFILLLSIFLLLLKSRLKLRYLMLLGFSPRELGAYYERLVVVVNVSITVVALALTFAGRMLWAPGLHELNLGGAPVWPVILVALIYLLGISVLDVFIIRRHLLRIWRNR